MQGPELANSEAVELDVEEGVGIAELVEVVEQMGHLDQATGELGNRDVIKMKRRNLRRVSMLRDTTMLRAVQIAIIMLILVCSCLSMLRSVWRCFRPIFI